MFMYYALALCRTCSLRIMDGGIEKKYPAFTPSMATDGFPSKACSRAFLTPGGSLEAFQFLIKQFYLQAKTESVLYLALLGGGLWVFLQSGNEHF